MLMINGLDQYTKLFNALRLITCLVCVYLPKILGNVTQVYPFTHLNKTQALKIYRSQQIM